MIKQVNFFAGFILILLISTSLVATASDTLNYRKAVPSNALVDAPDYVVLNLFISQDDVIPIASQTYFPGDWQLSEESGANVLQIDIADVSSLEQYENLWVETEINGVVVGSREAIMIAPPGISVGGLVESRDAGFKFPDATEQTTAGVTPGDLSAHQANASAHHSPLVTTTEIVDGTIMPDDLNESSNFKYYGLINTGGDVNFWDTAHGMRWKDYAGANQRAWIYTSTNSWKLEHTMYSGRDVLVSNADGIGIGTDAPTNTHAVTIPSLNVTGNLEIGLETVVASYNVTSSRACDIWGGATCFYGSGSVSCPVGKKVLGGGTFASSGAYGEITSNYPSTSTSWSCASTYNFSTSTSCYAICARLE